MMRECKFRFLLKWWSSNFLIIFSTRDERSHAKLSLNRTFYCDRWSKNRCVTSMDWSTHFPELLCASYHNNEVEKFRFILKLSKTNVFCVYFRKVQTNQTASSWCGTQNSRNKHLRMCSTVKVPSCQRVSLNFIPIWFLAVLTLARLSFGITGYRNALQFNAHPWVQLHIL